MDFGGLDTRWWNLSAGVLAISVVGCGPTIVLLGDTEGTVDDGTGSLPDGDDDGISPPTGGMMPCTVNSECPVGLTCIDGACREGYADDNVDYSDNVDNVDYSDYAEYSEYSDYNDYSDYAEYKDYSDYNDDYYCYEYGPRGQCCDYEPCPSVCESDDECGYNEICLPLPDSPLSECAGVVELPDCGELSTAISMDLEVGESPVIPLAFVDGAGAGEIVVGYASGAGLVSDAAGPQVLPLPDTGAVAATSGDFNGDLINDLVVADDAGSTHILVGDGLGGFVSNQVLSDNGVLTEIHTLRFDDDTAVDLAARNSGSGALLFRNDGLGMFGEANPLATVGGVAYSIAVGAADDGTQDDVVVSRPLRDELFLGADVEGKSIQPDITGVLGVAHGERLVDLIDFDGDGVATLTGTTPRFGWTLLETTVAGGVAYVSVPGGMARAGTGDFDGDGVPDLVMVGPGTGAVVVARGVADPGPGSSFECYYVVFTDNEAEAGVVGDYDGNGRADILVGNGDTIDLITSL